MAELNRIRAGVFDTVGNTPLVRKKLSNALGRKIFAKAEYVNPGGSIKVCAAKSMTCPPRLKAV